MSTNFIIEGAAAVTAWLEAQGIESAQSAWFSTEFPTLGNLPHVKVGEQDFVRVFAGQSVEVWETFSNSGQEHMEGRARWGDVEFRVSAVRAAEVRPSRRTEVL